MTVANDNIKALFRGVPETECVARLRELRVATALLVGPATAVTVALEAAIADSAALDRALGELAALPALRRRRIFATIAHAWPAPLRRGGDAHANRRRARDAALRDLGPLVAPEMPAEAQARAVHDRLQRYRPAPGEMLPERLLMARVVETGLPVPGVDRLKRILKPGEQ